MKRLIFFVIAALLILPASVQAQSQFPPYNNQSSPVDLLASYYDAINRQDYARAYNYWETAPQTYAQFANGFADTLSAQLIVQPPTFVDAGAGNLHVQIPAVVIAQHRDGTYHFYAGCFTTHKSNLHPPDIPQEDVWHISRGQLRVVANNSSIPNLLASACTL